MQNFHHSSSCGAASEAGKQSPALFEQVAWEEVLVHPLMQQELRPAGVLLAVPVLRWAVTLAQSLLGTQELLDPELLRMAAICSRTLP